jgi:hypothetical protein
MHLTRLIAIAAISMILNNCNTAERSKNAEEIVRILRSDLSKQYNLKADTVVNLNFKGTYLLSYQQYCKIPLNLESNIVSVSSGEVKDYADSSSTFPKYIVVEIYVLKSKDQAENIFNLVNDKLREKNGMSVNNNYCIEDANAMIDTIFTKSSYILVAKYERFSREKLSEMIHFLQADFDKQ